MNRSEVVALTRFVKAACPHQAIDELTPDAWAHLLDDIRIEDARAAVIAITKRQPFVAPAEIRTEVARIRARRVETTVLEPPSEVADDTAAYLRWLRGARRSVADGEGTPVAPGVVVRSPGLRDLIANAVKSVDEA